MTQQVYQSQQFTTSRCAQRGAAIPFAVLLFVVSCQSFVVSPAAEASTIEHASQNDVLTTGLVGLWSFDGPDVSGTTAYDRSGNGNNGTVNNPAEVPGKIGQAINLAWDSVTVTQHASINLGTTVSMAFWIKSLPSATGFVQIMFKGNDLTQDWMIQQSSTNPHLYIRVDTSGGTNQVPCGAPAVSNVLDNNWHHIVFILDNGTCTSYKDGVPGGSGTYTVGGGFGNSLNFVLVTQADGTMNDSLDDVRMYNRALSAQEVGALYTLGQTTRQASQNDVLTSGLVGLWSFDGPDVSGTTASDRSGQGNTGTLTNMTGAANAVSGQLGQALDFNGTDDYVETASNPASLDLTNNQITLAAWVYTDTVTPYQIAVCKPVSASAHTNPFFSYQLGFNTDADKAQFLLATGTGAGEFVRLVSTSALVSGRWYHLAGTYNGSTMTIYINGTNEGTAANTANLVSFATPLRIGTNGGFTEDWDGKLDDVRIYNRALSAQEVAALYTLGQTTRQASQNDVLANGLVGLWSFDGPDVSGTTASDRSGQGNNGTLNSGPTTAAGKLGQALDFDGVDDDVSVSGAFGSFPTDMSVSSWVYMDVHNTRQDVVNAAGDTIIVYPAVATFTGAFDYGAGWRVTTGGGAPQANRWYHLVYTFNDAADQQRLYLDGVQVGSTSHPESISWEGGGTTYIGAGVGGTTDPTNGKIDDIRLYDRALSAQEVADLYHLGR